jgi:hypothetical protein
MGNIKSTTGISQGRKKANGALPFFVTVGLVTNG